MSVCLSVCHVMDHHTSVFYHVYSSRHIVSLVLQIAKPRYKLSILDHEAWPRSPTRLRSSMCTSTPREYSRSGQFLVLLQNLSVSLDQLRFDPFNETINYMTNHKNLVSSLKYIQGIGCLFKRNT